MNAKAIDYSQWKLPCHQYTSLEEATRYVLDKDGIHHVPCQLSVLDLLVEGSGRIRNTKGTSSVLVAFNGAIANRAGKIAPFFSGRGVAKLLGLPLVSISDPTLALDEDISLAWYAGNEAIPKLPRYIAKILIGIATHYEARLILFGGSGGGFAVLSQLHILQCNATGFVWNPQTSISEYEPDTVRTYLSTAFPKLREEVSRTRQVGKVEARVMLKLLLDKADICHDLIATPSARQGSLLYIQNQGDWHLSRHAAPYLGRGKWSRLSARAFAETGGRSACWFGNWGNGHAVPPRELIEAIFSDLAAGKAITQIAGDLDASLTENDIPFSWFDGGCVKKNPSVEAQIHNRQVIELGVYEGTDTHPSKETVTTNRINYSIDKVILKHEPDDVLMVTVESNAPATGQFAFYVFRNRERIHTQWYSPAPTLRFCIKAEPGLYRVLAFLRTSDGATIKKSSKPVFLHPVVYTLGHAFKRPEPEEHTLLLHGQNWKFPALYYAGKEQQRLFVMLSAAIDRTKHILPVFNRWTWAEAGKFPGHVLCVADPTLELHDAMKLGWYLGTGEHDATEELSRLIRDFAAALGIPDGKIVFWGSSGGGFGALALASRIEKATAVAINAQTDIFAYEITRTREAVRANCFGNQTVGHIREGFAPRVNMAEAWRDNKSSRVILIQNKLDTHHYACHFKPFWEAVGGTSEGGAAADGRHYAWLYSDPNGHAPESEQMIPSILDLINQDSFTGSTVMPTIRASKA